VERFTYANYVPVVSEQCWNVNDARACTYRARVCNADIQQAQQRTELFSRQLHNTSTCRSM